MCCRSAIESESVLYPTTRDAILIPPSSLSDSTSLSLSDPSLVSSTFARLTTLTCAVPSASLVLSLVDSWFLTLSSFTAAAAFCSLCFVFPASCSLLLLAFSPEAGVLLDCLDMTCSSAALMLLVIEAVALPELMIVTTAWVLFAAGRCC